MEVTGITVARAQQIEDRSVVSGAINPSTGHLILTNAGGTVQDAGQVVPQRDETIKRFFSFNASLNMADYPDAHTLEIEIWGGGGGGSYANNAGGHTFGGGGGGYQYLKFRKDQHPAIFTSVIPVEIGLGGSAGTSTQAAGNGTASVVIIPNLYDETPAIPTVYVGAGGGFGGTAYYPGGGGGVWAASGQPASAQANGVGGGATGVYKGGSVGDHVQSAVYGGGCGGTQDSMPGYSRYGGGGGEAGIVSGSAQPLGRAKSIYGGNGGRGGSSTATATSGDMPGGGGGGRGYTGAAGNGAKGSVIFYITSTIG